MKNTILILITVAAIITSVYLWYPAGQQPQTTLERSSASGQTSAEVGDLLAILQTLQSIKIDTAYLNDPNFKILIDFAPVTAEPSVKGRPNPFIAAAGANVYVAATTTRLVGRQ